jgi:hypothetical protein
MLVTHFNITLYGCKNWRLAQAIAHRIQPDAPEKDALEENSEHSLTIGGGQMEQ